jgi:Domain of unknown function (DUF3601)
VSRHTECSICRTIGDREYALQVGGRPDECTYLPAAVENLRLVRELPESTESDEPGSRYLQECPECRTYYLYRTTYEYIVYGSEDEQFLRRLTDEEGNALAPAGPDEPFAHGFDQQSLGPKPKGFWTGLARQANSDYHHLVAGEWYTVVKGFWDYDRQGHPEMETWLFRGSSFSPYSDGLSLFVSFDGEHEWHIRLQCADDQQGPIVDSLEDYVVPTLSSAVPKAECDTSRKPVVQREWCWWPDEFGGPATQLSIGANGVHWHIDADDDFKQSSRDADQSIEDFLTKGPAWTVPDEVAQSIWLHFGFCRTPAR